MSLDSSTIHIYTHTTLFLSHGLDARHARVLPAGSGVPPLAPPRADVQPRVRVHRELHPAAVARRGRTRQGLPAVEDAGRSEEHTSELQSHSDLVCRLLLDKK